MRGPKGGQKSAPRELESKVGRDAGRVLENWSRPITPLEKAPRVAVQYRANVKKVHLGQAGVIRPGSTWKRDGTRRCRRTAPLRCRHPHLAAALEPREQRRAALRDRDARRPRRAAGSAARRGARRPARHGRGRGRAAAPSARRSRTARGRHLLGAVHHRQILAVRTLGRAAGGRVARPVGAKLCGQVAAVPALERDRRRAGIVVGGAASRSLERRDGARRASRERGAMLGHRCLERRRASSGPGRLVGQQLVACAHRRFVARGMVRMARLEREHEPVEEAPAVPGAAGEQPVHRRGQPQHRQPFAERIDRGRRRH